MIIRQETENDYEEVYRLVKQAFATTSYSDGTEQDYLNEIRKKETFIPELSLVAIEHDRIVGQIVLYQMQIKDKDRTDVQLVVSPLSVHTEYFNQGIGSKLLAEGCRVARDLGYQAVFLCGDADYYCRFGFRPTWQYGIFHVNDPEKRADWCMVKELQDGYLKNVSGMIDIE